jgi:predicted RNA-binding protein with TRAM domain
MALKVGQQLELELEHITADGKGVAWGPEDKLVLIEEVEEGDAMVLVKIDRVLEEAVLAKKIGGTKAIKQPKSKGVVDSPYEMDGDVGEDEEYGDDS